MDRENALPELTACEIEEIKTKARSKLGECKKTYDVIGVQLFHILSMYARVIYYPLGKKAPWGFTHMRGSSGGAASEKPFVAINTSIPIDCQIFAAAHELYHIWYDSSDDAVTEAVLAEAGENRNELKANRFAAEFLVDADMLSQEMRFYDIDPARITIKDILVMAALFTVPYRTMVKRLHESGVIDKKARGCFLAETDENIAKYRKIYSIPTPEADERIAIDNMVELAANAYEAGLITYEKLEYLLRVNDLKPEDIGASSPAIYDPPSEEELDIIMEGRELE
ncbi:MAG: ImmA/IrrE family metallo-endopeptidase [Synergistaceae bacterium]|nr:ImmA/IrrE family metallo-endopeptidase [Synergistaceae bacterium]